MIRKKKKKKSSRHSAGTSNVSKKNSEDLKQDSIHTHQEETDPKNSLFKNIEYLWISWGKAANVVIDLLENKASVHESKTPLEKTSKTKEELI